MSEVSDAAVVRSGVRLGDDVRVGPFAVVGKPFRLVDGEPLVTDRTTRVGDRAQIGSHAIVGKGSRLGADCSVEDYCKLEQDVDLGPETHVVHRAKVDNDATVGREAVVGGFVGERSRVGDEARVFGGLVHRQLDPRLGWDDNVEPAPVVETGAFVGWGATVVGDVTVGERAYVTADALVTSDVPPRTIAHGHNQVSEPEEWTGDLGESAQFGE